MLTLCYDGGRLTGGKSHTDCEHKAIIHIFLDVCRTPRTTELKVNLLAPARPDAGEMVARGRVVRPGRTLTVCRSDVCIGSDAVATFLMTMFAMPHEP